MGSRRRGFVVWLSAAVAIVAVTAVTLWAMGRVPICTCGHVKLWHGVGSAMYLLQWICASVTLWKVAA